MSNGTKQSGTVTLLGAGPGDPSLITLRALSRLQAADVVLYDALAHPELLTHCRPDAELVYVGKRAGRASERQSDINQKLVEAARRGKRVVRLKGGDPYLFGRGSEEAEVLAQEGIPFEVVPGVPSPLAATAYAGISLTHRSMASSVAYITATESPDKDRTAHDWAKLATATQTLVIFMGLRKLDTLMTLLTDNGRPRDTPVAVISRASSPQQRTVVGTISDIASRVAEAQLSMPALTVVGPVVNLREHLRWFDTLPLFGKRVLVTRPEGQADAMAARLRERGAEPMLAPSIRIVPPDDNSPLKRAVETLDDYDWVVFTSVNGVSAFFAALEAAELDCRALGSCEVAAIGPATQQALLERGIRADVVPEEYRGERVAEAMVARAGSLTGKRVLLARAAVAREALPEMLREAGARVDVVAAYQSLGPSDDDAERVREALCKGEIDACTFTSPSTLERLLDELDAPAMRALANTTIAAIGPITQDAVTRAGLTAHVVAEPYTAEALVEALETHFSGRS